MILSGINIFYCLWGWLMRVLEPEKLHALCPCPEIIAANRNHVSFLLGATLGARGFSPAVSGVGHVSYFDPKTVQDLSPSQTSH